MVSFSSINSCMQYLHELVFYTNTHSERFNKLPGKNLQVRKQWRAISVALDILQVQPTGSELEHATNEDSLLHFF